MLEFLGIVALIFSSWVGVNRYMNHRKQQRYAAEMKNRQRLEECNQIGWRFNKVFGYLLAEMSERQKNQVKDDLQQAIDTGISPQALHTKILNIIDNQPGLKLGEFLLNGRPVDVKQPEYFRQRHTYIIGKTGTGKTNLLRQMFYPDFDNGAGVAIIAAERELLTEEVLPYIPSRRVKDVIYFNPADPNNKVFYNPLELLPGEKLHTKADELLVTFNRMLEGDSTRRMRYILRHTILALLAVPNTTLEDIERLLDRHDDHYRKYIISQLTTPAAQKTREFFASKFTRYPIDAAEPIFYRINTFIDSQPIAQAVCKPQSSFNIRQAMDEGKIILCNLSDGDLGVENARLLGGFLVSQFQLAAFSRSDIPKPQRRPFYLYIDEFQAFVNQDAKAFEVILERARKYMLCLIMAHQHLAQLPRALLKSVTGNVQSLIVFQVDGIDSKRMSIDLVNKEYNAITRIEPDQIIALEKGQAFCKIGSNSFLMATQLVTRPASETIANEIIKQSQVSQETPAATVEPAAEQETEVFPGVDPDEV